MIYHIFLFKPSIIIPISIILYYYQLEKQGFFLICVLACKVQNYLLRANFQKKFLLLIYLIKKLENLRMSKKTIDRVAVRHEIDRKSTPNMICG